MPPVRQMSRATDLWLPRGPLQAAHGAREVFLTRVADENDGARLLRPASVLPWEGFAAASGGPYSDDVFLCRYEYLKGFQARPGVLG